MDYHFERRKPVCSGSYRWYCGQGRIIGYGEGNFYDFEQKKDKKVLIDHRNIGTVSGRTLEVYDRPVEFKEIGVITGIKIAEIVKPEHKQFFTFLETVCVNRGHMFSIFDDQKSALEWLLQS